VVAKSRIALNKPLKARRSPKTYMGITEADLEYHQGLQRGLDEKTAAKQAQLKTGLSLLTGRPVKTKGFGVSYGRTSV
jgi:hypothetical protein